MKKRLDLSQTLERRLYEIAWDIVLAAPLQPSAATPAVKGDWKPLQSQDGGVFQRERIWLDK